MGFFNTLFQQQPAPIEDRSRLPQTPQVAQAPMVNPNPQLPMQVPPAMQGQPGSTPTPAVDQGKVDKWTALMNRIVQPDVLGPLQTFLAAASAPLEPGENLGARIGYAGTLMNLHKSMLEENARLAPYLQKERDLKIQKMEGEIARNQAAAEASQVQAQRTRQQMDQDWEAFPGGQEGKRLDREKTQQEIENLKRLPQAPGAGAGRAPKNPKYANLSDAAFRQSYEASVLNPYKRWAEEQAKQAQPYDWATYLATSRNVREINEMMDEAMARGMQLEDRRLGVPGQAGAAPATGAGAGVRTLDQVKASLGGDKETSAVSATPAAPAKTPTQAAVPATPKIGEKGYRPDVTQITPETYNLVSQSKTGVTVQKKGLGIAFRKFLTLEEAKKQGFIK